MKVDDQTFLLTIISVSIKKACNPKENLSQIEQSYHEQEQVDLF